MKTTGTIARRASGWVVNLRVDGRRRQLSCTSKADAQRRLAEALQGHTEATEKPSAGYTLREALNHAHEERWRGQTGERTAVLYAQQVVEFFGAQALVEDIDYLAAERFIKHLQEQGNQAQTINAKLSKLRILQAMALKHGGATQLAKLPSNLKLDNKQTLVWEDAEVRALVADLYGRGKEKEAAMFLFMNEMGCRFSEAERLKGQDIDLERGLIAFWKAKADNKEGNRVLKLTPTAWECIQPYVPAIPSHRVWQLKYNALLFQVRQSMDRLGISKARPLHTTRHTCGSKLGRAGLSGLQISAWLGHNSPTMSARYVHLDTAALDGCHEALSAASAGSITNIAGRK